MCGDLRSRCRRTADQGIEYYKSPVLALGQIEGLDGFLQRHFTVDRTWARCSLRPDSFDAMERNRDQSNALKATSPVRRTDECGPSWRAMHRYPSWSDQPAGGSTRLSPTLGPALLKQRVERRSRYSSQAQPVGGRYLRGPVAPPGRCPDMGGGRSCTHVNHH